ncbi:MAG: lipopolysaccharide biosynthesis protein [Candidatus Firestonebacteria bacterium]|nr:lipopolysaccharide biosynthesis protein [Candidatus Firestonebacteria bacterium]
MTDMRPAVEHPGGKFFRQFWRVSFFQGINSASAFLVNILVARWIGPQAFGDFFVFVSTMTVATILFDFGLSRTVLRYAAFHQARGETVSKLQYYYATLKLKTLWGLGALGLAGLGAWIWGGALRVEYTLGFATGFVISYCQFLSSVAQTEDDYAAYNWVLSFNTLRLGLVIAVWLLGAMTLPRLYALFLVTPLLMAAIPAWRLLRELARAGKVPEEHFYANLIGFGKWMLVLVVLESLAQRLDVYLVRWLTSAEAAGHYSGALTFFGAVTLLPTYTAYLIYPKFVEAVSRGERATLESQYRFSTDLTAVLAVPLGMGLWAVAPDLIRLFLGAGFAPSVPLFKYFAAYAVLWSCQVNSGAMFFAHDQPRTVVGIVLMILLAGAGTQLLLIPRFGLPGAGLALATTSAVGLGLYWGFIRARFKLSPHFGHLGVYFLVGLAMAAVVRALPGGTWPWLLGKAALGGVIYAGGLLGLQKWQGWQLVQWPKKSA